jgi:hypothetical protein
MILTDFGVQRPAALKTGYLHRPKNTKISKFQKLRIVTPPPLNTMNFR